MAVLFVFFFWDSCGSNVGAFHIVPEVRPAARAGAAEGKGAPHLGRGRPSLWLPEPLRPGKTQHAGATESALLWRTRKLEPHSTQGPLHIEQPGA